MKKDHVLARLKSGKRGAIGLRVEQLLLDTENPRIGDASSQHDALQKVLDDQGEKLFELAQSIVAEGMSPIDRLLVLRENPKSDRFVALEGNRRVAALRILANPAVLTGLSVKRAMQKRLEDLAKDFVTANVEPIDCFESESREAGAPWLHLRHTGENEGRGVVDWSGHAAARFRGTDPALQALEFVKTHGNLTEAQLAAVGNSFPITTLDRLLSTPDVRKRIGVEVKDGKLYTALPPEELLKPLRRMVLDLAAKIVRVGRLMKKDQQVDYVEGFSKSERPNLSKRAKVRAVENIRESEFKTKPAKAKESRKSDPSDRKVVIPRAAKLNITDNKVAEIGKELRRLKVDESPHAIAVLLRVFLELSIDHYMDAHKLPLQYVEKGGNKHDKSLNKKMQEVSAHLVANGKVMKKDLLGVERAISDPKSPLHLNLLHAYVHNRFVSPKARELISAWNEAQRFMECIWA
jgi:hypothetical protein